MQYHKIPYLAYLWSDPQLRQMLLLLIGAVFFEACVLLIMFGMNLNMAQAISEKEDDEAPRHVYVFSKQGQVDVYDDRILIWRNGTCVSGALTEIWDVTWNDSRDDRVLYVKHMGPEGPVTEAVRCGPMDIFEAMKVRDMLLHYMGG